MTSSAEGESPCTAADAASGKQRLRKQMLARRKALTEDQVQEASRAAQQLLMQHSSWRQARTVLLYAACRNELQTDLLLHDLWNRGATALLPRCCTNEHKRLTGELELCMVSEAGQLSAGAYGILEPDALSCPSCSEAPVDLAILPGVAFDAEGWRLGYGGGYYDRLLASGRLDGALLAGLAYHWQLAPCVPRDPWDKPVRLVCTDKELLWT